MKKKKLPKITSNLSGVQHLFGTLSVSKILYFLKYIIQSS